jgi:tryptophan halogenase
MIQNVLVLGAGSAGLITAISIKRKIPGLRCCSQAIPDRDAAEEFQSLHYKFNGMLDTPFWPHAQADADVSGVGELLEFYEENGPTGFCRCRLPRTESDFGLEGFLVMLVGNKVPYRKLHPATPAELATWERRKRAFIGEARKGIRSEEALAYAKHPGWQWNADRVGCF